MKAKSKDNELQGTVSADLSNKYGIINYKLETLNSFFGLDEDKYRIIGLSLRHISAWHIDILCETKDDKGCCNGKIEKISYNNPIPENLFAEFFREIHIVLYNNDGKFSYEG